VKENQELHSDMLLLFQGCVCGGIPGDDMQDVHSAYTCGAVLNYGAVTEARFYEHDQNK
jgi:hypothetical protein